MTASAPASAAARSVPTTYGVGTGRYSLPPWKTTTTASTRFRSLSICRSSLHTSIPYAPGPPSTDRHASPSAQLTSDVRAAPERRSRLRNRRTALVEDAFDVEDIPIALPEEGKHIAVHSFRKFYHTRLIRADRSPIRGERHRGCAGRAFRRRRSAPTPLSLLPIDRHDRPPDNE